MRKRRVRRKPQAAALEVKEEAIPHEHYKEKRGEGKEKQEEGRGKKTEKVQLVTIGIF